MKLIDKDALIAEIERLRKEDGNPYFPSETADKYYTRGVHFTCDGLVNFLDTLEVKEVDLEKEVNNFLEQQKAFVNEDRVVEHDNGDTFNHIYDLEDVAKHFFELGLKANQENNVIGTFERKVKFDVAGYPYIDCDIEFYDYDKDIPLAKKGDKVKVIVVKGE